MTSPLHVRLSWTLLGVLGLAAVVAAAAHELGHHAIAAVECGGFGRVTFTRFQELEGCRSIVANISGPAISFAILWLGAIALAGGRAPLRGLAAVVASMPLLRLGSVASGGDDWTYTAGLLTGDRHVVLLTVAVLCLIVPPLVFAWRRLSNRRRWLLLPALLILPVAPGIVLQVIDVAVYHRWIDDPASFTQPTLLGIPLVVMAVYGTAAFCFARWAYPWLKRNEPAAEF